MKWLLLLILPLLTTCKVEKVVISKEVLLPTITVSCNCLETTYFSSYKILEDKYNETRYISKNIKIADAYDVPPIIALGGKYKRIFKLGDTIRYIINGVFYKRVYLDNMKHTGKWKTVNYNRNDIAINKDDKFFLLKGKIMVNK